MTPADELKIEALQRANMPGLSTDEIVARAEAFLKFLRGDLQPSAHWPAATSAKAAAERRGFAD